MAVTRQHHEAIDRNRTVYLRSPSGKAVFKRWLQTLGVFASPAELASRERADAAVTCHDLIQGLCLLEQCGVLIPENLDLLIDRMAELPMPMIGETNGETT